MRANASESTGKSSKQTQHVSASLCGCAGFVDDDSAEEEDDFEAELDVIDVVSVALTLAVCSVGSEALVSDSILAAMALRYYVALILFFLPLS